MLALPGEALLQLIVASTILPALIYGGIVVLYLCVRGRLERRTGGFSLGRFEVPVAVVALIWVAFALFVLLTPESARVPGLVVLGLLALGAVYFGFLLATHPDVLDQEPDGGDAVAAIEADPGSTPAPTPAPTPATTTTSKDCA